MTAAVHPETPGLPKGPAAALAGPGKPHADASPASPTTAPSLAQGADLLKILLLGTTLIALSFCFRKAMKTTPPNGPHPTSEQAHGSSLKVQA